MLQPQSDTGTTADTGTMGRGEVREEVEVANPFLPGTVVSRDAAWMVELWRAGNLHQYGSCSHQVTRQQRGLSTFKYYEPKGDMMYSAAQMVLLSVTLPSSI